MGVSDVSVIIDHKDGNGLNNQKSNLRLCSQSQNCMNRKPKNLIFKKSGIWFDSRRNKYEVKINAGGKRVYRKRFTTLDEAIFNRSNWEMEIFKEFTPK